MTKCKDCKFIVSKQYFIIDDKFYHHCKITTDWAADSEVHPETKSCQYFKPINSPNYCKLIFEKFKSFISGWFK